MTFSLFEGPIKYFKELKKIVDVQQAILKKRLKLKQTDKNLKIKNQELKDFKYSQKCEGTNVSDKDCYPTLKNAINNEYKKKKICN